MGINLLFYFNIKNIIIIIILNLYLVIIKIRVKNQIKKINDFNLFFTNNLI